MSLTTEERKALADYRLEKSDQSMVEAKDNARLGHWTLAANRLYYALFHAANALLVSKELTAKTHSGVISLLSQKFVKTDLLTREDGVLIARLQSMRNTGDYDDFFEWEETDIQPLFSKVETLLLKMRALI